MAFSITHEYEEDGTVTVLNPMAHVDQMPLYGIERAAGIDPQLPISKRAIAFRLYDDDGTLNFSGKLDDDDDCANQTAALRWGETMMGSTVIKVRRDKQWIQEIG